MLVNADFHVHSCFSMASSKDMLIKNMAPKSKLKGLQLLGTGDAFHPGWLNILRKVQLVREMEFTLQMIWILF